MATKKQNRRSVVRKNRRVLNALVNKEDAVVKVPGNLNYHGYGAGLNCRSFVNNRFA